MSKPTKDDQYSDEEAKERAEKALRGAFKTPPQPIEKDRGANGSRPKKK